MRALITDLRSAGRSLLAARGFTAIAVLTLGAGMTLCITVMMVMNAYLIKALPYPHADRLYRVDYAAPGQRAPRGLADLDWRAIDEVAELQIAWDLDVFFLLGGEFPESAPGAWVTPDYIDGLGIRPARGRAFEPSDYQAGSPPVAIISHQLWQSRFNGDPQILGRGFQAYVSDRPDEPETFTIVGVLPEDLWHLNAYTQVLAPLKAATYPYQLRLRAGVTREAAASRLAAFVRGNLPWESADAAAAWQPTLTRLQDSYTAATRPVLWSIGAGAALVLLIAGANVAVLLLVRGRRRQRELAIRQALGASQGRLARLLVLEGTLIGGAATALGLVASRAAMASLAPGIERFLERRVPGGLSELAMDWTVLAAAVTFGMTVTLIFALMPLLTLWRDNPAAGLSASSRGATDARGARRLRSVLIATEVAASLALLAGASLMADSALRMLRVDFGIAPEPVVTASLSLRDRSYPDTASRAAFFERLIAELRQLRGVSSVAIGDWSPLQTPQPSRVRGSGPAPVAGDANFFDVSADYFATVGMTIHDGRAFTPQDVIGSEQVVIVSQSLARRLWPDRRAVGELLTVEGEDDAPPVTYRVVGVVNDVRQSHRDTHTADSYRPLAQNAGRFAYVFLRGAAGEGWDAALRSAAARVDREAALGATRPLDEGLEQERAKPRFLAWMLSIFAAFACVLALVGMHGVIAYAARQRQREIAVRIAIGADAGAVTRMFLRQGGIVLAAGIAAGLTGAVALGRVLQSQLHDVQPHEPRLLAGAALLFAACGLLAMWWPAWRAAATDPVLVLKEE